MIRMNIAIAARVSDGKKKVVYDINLTEKPHVEPASLDKLAGNYTCQEKEEITSTFFRLEKTPLA